MALTFPTPALLARRKARTQPPADTATEQPLALMPQPLSAFLNTRNATRLNLPIEGWKTTEAPDGRPHIEARLTPTTQEIAEAELFRLASKRPGGQFDIDTTDRVAITYLQRDGDRGTWLTFWHPTR